MPRRPVPTRFWRSRRTTSGPPTTLPKSTLVESQTPPTCPSCYITFRRAPAPTCRRARGQARRRHPNICGIKDTVDTISHTRKVIRAVREVNPEFSVLSGFDEYYLVNRASGGNGVLCGLTNVEPELFVRLHGAYQAGDFATAIECAKRISSLMAVYDACDLFISAIKVAVNIKGLPISTAIFDPAIQASDDQKATIEQLLS